jgi:hypothetical protein
LCICFCSCAFVFAVVLFFCRFAIFFAVVLISCMFPTYNFAVVSFILQLYNFFLQLYNFFCSRTIFFAVVQFTPRPDEILDNAKTSNSTLDLEQKKKGPSWVIPLSLSPTPGYLRQPSPCNYFAHGMWGCAVGTRQNNGPPLSKKLKLVRVCHRPWLYGGKHSSLKVAIR